MKFEHLIEINNLSNPTIPPLSRSQLWRGLVLRAESPKMFMQHLESFEITERTEASMQRSLNYGKVMIRDRVTFLLEHQVRYHVAAQGDFSDSLLTVTIEEPQPDALFVRFSYEDASPDEGAEAMYNDFRRSAYLEADIDTIHLIRQLAEQGRLG
ncbi:MAG: hypothetical protein H6R01_1463 [Burkholderiaceae bacterium]|nr:hypothetical protein [Burkholderiaceae bacterium]